MRGNGRYAATGRRTVSRRSCPKAGYSIRRLKRNLSSYTFRNARTLRSQLPNHQLLQKLRQSLKGNPPREESLEIQKAEKIPETMKPINKLPGRTWELFQIGFSFFGIA